MKKTYIAPAIEIAEISAVEVIASSLNFILDDSNNEFTGDDFNAPELHGWLDD